MSWWKIVLAVLAAIMLARGVYGFAQPGGSTVRPYSPPAPVVVFTGPCSWDAQARGLC